MIYYTMLYMKLVKPSGMKKENMREAKINELQTNSTNKNKLM